MINLEDLKAKALAATPGEWVLRNRGVICAGPATEYARGKGQPQIVMCCGGDQIGHEQKAANEKFIAAAHPAIVLELIERLKTAEAQLDSARKQEPAVSIGPSGKVAYNPNYEGPYCGQFFAKTLPP